MNILVIPEDFRKDQFILKPIIRAAFAQIGYGKAKIEICRDPLLGGISEAMKWPVLQGILDRYKWQVDFFLLCVDRDCSESRATALRSLELKAKAILPEGRHFVAEHAFQELEVWILAGHPLPKAWIWNAIRNERDPKERYYLPFAALKGCMDHPAEGRGVLAIEAARNYKRIRKLCPEDIANLEARIADLLQSR